MQGTAPIQLYSMMICPFAQRTRIHLELLELPYVLEDLDICAPRPDWFLALNPAGQVPVIVRGDDVVSDSSVVSEYLQEIAPSPLPFGTSAVERARQRGFVKYVDSRFLPAMYLLLAARTPDEREQRIAAALETFRWLEDFLVTPSSGTPFINGEFGVPEVAIAPFLLRYEVVRYYQDFELPESGAFDRVIRWRDAMLALPVVQKTAESIPDLIKLYEDYTIGSYNGAVPPGKERSSLDLAAPLAERPMPGRAASVR
ncbi:MAG: glutathione S-transferase family protein [Myxococcota bacterium]